MMSEFATKLRDVTERFSDDAAAVDRATSLPANHLDALASIGLYGASAPVLEGGLGLTSLELWGVVEELASACLASTFVWLQHSRLLAAAFNDGAPEFVRRQRTKIANGEIKGGVALGGLLPGPARLKATPTSRGWILDGEAPWVSGWGLVDTLLVAARGPDNTVVNVLVAARDQPGLIVTRHQLAALNATVTVRLGFESLEVDALQVLGQVPYEPEKESGVGLRANGSLALGVARRCCSLLGPSALDDELRRCRHDLDTANAEEMPRARARASELAVRTALALSVQRGSSSVNSGDIAERSIREAALLLTFGSRPTIRRALLEELGMIRPN
jgi:alkylation response protein AidB-like acyl-CoA dehydrogenase